MSFDLNFNFSRGLEDHYAPLESRTKEKTERSDSYRSDPSRETRTSHSHSRCDVDRFEKVEIFQFDAYSDKLQHQITGTLRNLKKGDWSDWADVCFRNINYFGFQNATTALSITSNLPSREYGRFVAQNRKIIERLIEIIKLEIFETFRQDFVVASVGPALLSGVQCFFSSPQGGS